jgi:hypothetical protein
MISRLVRGATLGLSLLALPGLAATAYALAVVRVLPPAPMTRGLPTPAVGQILKIPTPVAPRVSPSLRQEEQFLNTLVGSEARLIKSQRTLIHATMPLYSELTSLDALLARSPHPGAGLINSVALLTSRVQVIDAQLALNQQRLDLGFTNELNAFNIVNATNPNMHNRNTYLTAFGLQDFQVNRLATYQFPVAPATPVNLPPNRH